MKLNNLIPLKEVSTDKLRELFNKNNNFAWNLRHYAEANDADFIKEVLDTFDENVKLDWEFGIYTRCRFSVNHDPASLQGFALGCIKILKDYGFFKTDGKEKDVKLIELLAFHAEAYAHCDPSLEDEILEKAFVSMDAVAAVIAERIRETFEHWESDNNILDEMLDEFVDCYGEDVFLDPTDDSLVEIKKMDMWDLY